MGQKESCESGGKLWKVAGGAALALGAFVLVRAVPDIVRYLKIRSM